ncbi:MAG: uL30 family ribosomal protein [Nanoarchaeota archaeon]|nr:uL30 family ribosomal protein [Nanoarchaeota archaeon]
MILIIRISGMIGIPRNIQETLFRMRLRRKYSAILLEDNNFNRKLLKRVRDYIAYGTIKKEILEKLIVLRGKSIEKGKSVDAKKIVDEIEKKSLEKQGLKPFFRLHPPRRGIESKKHFGIGKGVLGDNKEKINELVERML